MVDAHTFAIVPETSQPELAEPGSPDAVLPGPALSPYKCKSVHFRGLRMDHFLVPGGRLRRYVVLETPRLRELLSQPRRREIEPLCMKQREFELRTSELCEMAWPLALRYLRALHRHAMDIERHREAERHPRERSHAVRRAPAANLSRSVSAVPLTAETRGRLLHAGLRPDGGFAIDVYDEEARQVRRLDSTTDQDRIEVIRALEESGAEPLDLIHIRRTAEVDVPIREYRTGSHGEGQRTVRHRRPTFEVRLEGRAVDRPRTPEPMNANRTLSPHRAAAAGEPW